MQPETNKHTVRISNPQGCPLQRKYVCMVNHKPSVHLGEQSAAGLLLSCENIVISKYTMTEEKLFYPQFQRTECAGNKFSIRMEHHIRVQDETLVCFWDFYVIVPQPIGQIQFALFSCHFQSGFFNLQKFIRQTLLTNNSAAPFSFDQSGKFNRQSLQK